MSWIPSINRLFILIKNLEASENPLKDSSELCWLFCTGMQSPEEFRERMAWWKDYHRLQSQQGGEFLDKELEAIMTIGFDDPDKAAQLVLERLDRLADALLIPYRPDEPEPAEKLYVYTHIESARLFRMLKTGAYSERTREMLSSALNAFNRCDKAENTVSTLSLEYSMSLKTLGSFLHMTQFLIQKIDGDYESALKSLEKSITPIETALAISILPSIELPDIPKQKTPALIPFIRSLYENKYIGDSVPWFQNLEPHIFVKCLEALMSGKQVADIEDTMEACGTILYASQRWLPDSQTEGYTDADGYYWEHTSDFWQYALGWLEAQLTPSEFKDILNEREEQAAEKRLRTYFFEEKLWNRLPERAKKSLVSADRDWFSGKLIRIESVLNELKIAAEQILLYGLWIPLDQWGQYERDTNKELKIFAEMSAELMTKRISPDLSHFERVCRLPVAVSFLSRKGVTPSEQEWLIKTLPGQLAWLRGERRDAEHEPSKQWTHDDLTEFYTEFIGIGQRGVIPEMAKILLLSPK